MLMLTLAHAGEHASGVFPPIHPILVNFTAGLLPISLVADLFGRVLQRASLRDTGWWTLAAAAALTPVTAAAGWFWKQSMSDMDHWQLQYHQWVGIVLAAALIVITVWRARFQRQHRSPSWTYLAAIALTVGVLVVQGELGGAMSFGGTVLFSSP